MTSLHLFDTCILPIIEYDSEIWFRGGKNFEIIERLHLRFLKSLLHVKSQTCTQAVYGELGRYPLKIKIQVKLLKYWARLINLPQEHKLRTVYDHLLKLDEKGKSNWTTSVKKLLNSCQMDIYWTSQSVPQINLFISTASDFLHKQFENSWKNAIRNQTILRTYIKFKADFQFEKYLYINSSVIRTAITQFRVSSHHLEIEKGRHHKPKPIPKENRKCLKCDNDDVEDEIHFILHCTKYQEPRAKLFSALAKHIPVSGHTSEQIFSTLFNLNIAQSRVVGQYIINASKLRDQR